MFRRLCDLIWARRLRRDPILRQWAQALRERGIAPDPRWLRFIGGTCPTR